MVCSHCTAVSLFSCWGPQLWGLKGEGAGFGDREVGTGGGGEGYKRKRDQFLPCSEGGRGCEVS